ncbi:MAG: hypothetical protein V3T20_05105 [Gemmatimonadota bacterium]
MSELRRLLTARVIDPIYWTGLKRYDFTARLAGLRATQWDSPGVFAERQGRRLARVLKHVVANVDFFAERAGDVTAADIEQDPWVALKRFRVLEKRDLEGYLASVTPEPERRAFMSSSGGSTGEPVRFYLDAASDSIGLASTQLLYEWAGIHRGDGRVMLWGARQEVSARASTARRLLDRLLRNLTVLDAFDLGPDAMRSYALTVSRLRPVCIEGYAEALFAFVEFLEQEGTTVPPPRAVISSASTLMPHMREKIESVLGAPVFDRYGSREVAAIAAECDHHTGLHVLGETALIEVVDDTGAEVAVGCEGDILVTTLANLTMPLIRYRIGDRAILGAELCSCGRPYPMLSAITGRTCSCLRRPDGGVVSMCAVTHIIGVECNSGAIRSFQVVQESLEDIVVRLVPQPGVNELVLKQTGQITSRLRDVMGSNCRVRFVVEDRIDAAASGKHAYVISHVGEETA